MSDDYSDKWAAISEILTEMDCPKCDGEGCRSCEHSGVDPEASRANDLLNELYREYVNAINGNANVALDLARKLRKEGTEARVKQWEEE